MTCRKNVTHHEWIDDMVNEFKHEYKRHAEDAMESFLDCIFEILRSSKGRTKPYQEQISKLGTQLKNSSVIDDKKYPHHRYIMRLLEIGLLRRHSHMFILPQINKETLLNNQYYCSLILAAKLYALGKYDEAVNYAEKIGQNCSLALYICGQSYRKIGDYAKAHAHLQQGIKLLGQGKCGCPFTGKEEGICNEDLLKAVLFRARAVVFRKQKEFAKAEECYKKAKEAVDKAMKNIKSSPGKAPEKISLSGDNISVEFGEESSVRLVTEVAADVYFSFGYHYYNQRNYDQAEKLFKKSIEALEVSQVDWDSPYTRLAIVKFCQGKYRKANELFAKAAMICKKTIHTNREASLSLALCVLGCKLTNDLIGQVSADNPIDKLEDAINQAPRLTLGPLECHLDDAKHFCEKELSPPAKKLVKEFINRIRQEIFRIIFVPTSSDSEHWELIVQQDNGLKYELRIGNSLKHYMHKVKISNMYIDKILDDFGSGKIKYDDLIVLGRDLVNKLFPKDLEKLFSQSTKGKTLLLWLDKETSQIPWELMVFKVLENNKTDYKFLCEHFQVGRWLCGKQNPTREIRISPLALVTYDGGGTLNGVYQELSAIQNLNLLTRIYSTRKEVLDLFKTWNTKDYYGLHFSGESQYDKNHPFGSSFELEDAPLRREDLNILIDNLPCGLEGPSFIFLNFCESARQSLILTGFQGWVEHFLEIEPSALIATMWKAKDNSAAQFASKFYETLLQKKNSGLAMQEARKSIKDNNDLTWLCYVLYGDPRAQLR